MRRVLIATALGSVALVVATAGLAVWLVGTPFAAQEPRRATVLDAPCCRDLIPIPPTDGHGIGSVLARPSDPDRAQRALESTLVRAEPRTTPPLRHTLNILLVGLDRRFGASGGGRTDTLVLVVFDRGSDHVGLVSIPRDLYVLVPDHGPARINAAFNIGRRQGRDGLAVLERVVEDTFAIPIHHSLAVDLSIFERSVDAVGGVTVAVRCPIRDNFIDHRTTTGRRLLDVAAGRQHMDGPTAAMFVRSRHGRSDWDRARRQQAVLMALRERLITVGGVARVPALWEQLGASVVTDMNRLEIFALAARALRANPAHLHGLVIGYRQTDHWTTPEGRWVLLPRFEAIDDSLGRLFSAPSPGTRPSGAQCPAADVAITRPNRAALRRHARAMMQRVRHGRGLGHSESSDTASNSDHSSSDSSP